MAALYARQGSTSFGNILFSIWDDGTVRSGSTSFGNIIGRYDRSEGRIRLGNNPIGMGDTLFFIDSNNNLRSGSTYGPIVAHITYENNKIFLREGSTSFGSILLNFSKY